jgi:membrane-associated phospholipid phosphatase
MFPVCPLVVAVLLAVAYARTAQAQDPVAPAAPVAPADPPASIPPEAPAPSSPALGRDRADCYPARSAGHVACYERPSVFGFLLDVPRDIGGLARDSVRLENLPWTAGVVAATAGLIVYDQRLASRAKQASRWAGISPDGKTEKLASWFPLPYPTDVGSGMYYIGDGMVPVAVTVGMLGYGLVSQDTRVLRTASHLAEGLVGVGIVAQTIKRSTGRQSPSRATEDGGRWHPFPGVREYQKNVPGFDAFPSGHMATAMVTVTVLSEDYPEYRGWTLGIGYTLMAALGFQMMNNDVHWASDYPLALAVGYGLGKHAASRGRHVVDAAGASTGEGAAPRRAAVTFEVLPLPLEGGGGVSLAGTF